MAIKKKNNHSDKTKQYIGETTRKERKKRKNKVSGKLSHDPVIALLGIYAKDMKAVLASAAHILKT